MKTEEPGAPKPQRKPRKDKATRRVVLPARQVERFEKHARDIDFPPGEFFERLLSIYEESGIEITLPPSVLARLAPAAEGSGRSISELLAVMEWELCELLDGKLQFRSASADDVFPDLLIPSLEDRLVEAFRARIRAAEPKAELSPESAELLYALKAGVAASGRREGC